jgi:hypothetical protein
MIRALFPAPKARGPSRWLGLLGLAALVSAALAAQPAQAGQQITASSVLNQGNNAPQVTFKLNNGSARTVLAGSFTTTFHTASRYGGVGTTFETYCVDLSINLNSGTQTPAEVSQTNVASLNDANSVARNIGAAGWVLSNYGGSTAGDLASTLGVTFTGTALQKQRKAEAAIQVAIWKAAYESGSTNLASGILKFTSINAEISAAATKILLNRGNETAVIGFVDYPPSLTFQGTPNNQDQIFVLPEGSLEAIPEPSTLAMAAFGGLIGLGMLGRKRLRTRKATA